MKRKYLFLTAIIIAVVTLFGCSEEKKESKSMEQIQKEEGMPVSVQEVKPQKFEKHMTFFGNFKGEKESTIGAAIGGRIEKINYRPGDFVRKDEVIIQFPEDSPGSQYRQAKSAFENSQKTYNRMKALFEKGEIAQAKFDGVETKYMIDKRNFETMKDLLKIDAPFDGTITEILVHEGDNVKAKAALFTIVKLNKMKIRIWLADTERMAVKKGMKVVAELGDKMYNGKVSELSLSVNRMTRAFYADLIFDNSGREILAGATADVKIITYSKDDALAIPRNLVKNDGNRKYVFLANNGSAKKMFVEVVNENGSDYEIGGGINPGDKLIVKGSARLSDGTKIKVVN